MMCYPQSSTSCIFNRIHLNLMIFDRLKSYIREKQIYMSLRGKIRVILSFAVIFLVLNVSIISVNDMIFNFHLRSFNEHIQDIGSLLDRELARLEEKGKYLSGLESLRNEVEDRRIIDIISTIDEVGRNKGIESITVVDKNGIVLSRSEKIFKRGDYFLQTTNWGKLVLKGESFSFFEEKLDSALEMISAFPLVKDKEVVGAVIVSQIIDDNYIRSLSENVSGGNIDLAVFSAENGVVGSSFQDDTLRKILATNFTSDTKWVKEYSNKSDYIVNLNDEDYFIDSIDLPGDGQKAGELLVFYSFDIASKYVISTVIAFILFFACLSYYLYKKKGAVSSYRAMLAISCLILSLSVLSWSDFIQSRVYHKIDLKEKYTYKIYNSTIRFEPEYGIMDKHFSQRVSISVASGGENINAARVVVNFDPGKIIIEEIISTNSFCKLGTSDMFIERVIDNKKGEVIVSCGLPSPGFSGQRGIIAELIVRPIEEGFFSLKFGKESQVLANDGLGTNVLREASDSGYYITEFDNDNLEGKLVVFSPTHPNGEKWYAKKNVQLNWSSGDVDEYHYDFDNAPFTVPSSQNSTRDNFISFAAKDDGEYHFHIAGIKNDKIIFIHHYGFKIDNTPPSDLSVRASDSKIKAGDVVRIEIDSRDDASGMQSDYYYVKIDDGIYLPTKSPLFIPFIKSGKHQVSLMAYDKANNSREKTIEIEVEENPFFGFINFDWLNPDQLR